MKSTILKIIIVDNDQELYEGYRFFFETYRDYGLEGLFPSIKEALLDYENIMPDIVILETNLWKEDGIESIHKFRKKDPNVKVIMINERSDFERVKKAFKNGANGYLTKPLTKNRLHNALNSIKYEGAAMSNDIVQKIISNLNGKSYQSFSKRENQIIDYLCKGATYKVIAEKLFVTTSTINFHIQNIYLKLNVNSKSEALVKLRQL
ncbi:response regulator transcription factor [Maribacter polysiphoniae]|uniref:LuxR family two component transcriptional regulator n=1 Tax=Maribacter polysiphoniae TaxID=429344 RepID=A0A316E6K6_9FLAO|nr:response regulator transcription factor [Maribacter polysiphoniae]MBD1262342.1 response regulator transcription factor [Maribacter polysiphoniae]PWK26041.1 LuxR family two component transcriptional regulator [Maribacter polysiphoniae]